MDKQSLDAIRNIILIVLWGSLLVYLAWLSASATWLVLHEPSKQPLVLKSEAATGPQTQRDRASSIPGFQLFGRLGAKPVVVKEEKPKEAPKTNLRLRLNGVFTAEEQANSGAIIEEIGRTASYYKVGETVPGNATLEEVYDDRVLLRRGGKLETLSFEETKGSERSQISRAVNARPQPQRSRVVDEVEEIETPEQFVDVAARRLAENPEQALSSVGLSVSDGGGYVYNGNNPMLAGLNLKKGDVIRSVNGHNLGDIQQDRNLLQSLYEQGSLEVEVERNGTSFFVNYPLR